MLNIRLATWDDLNFLIETDLLGDGYTPSVDETPMTEADLAEHRQKIASFVSTPNDAAWLAEDDQTGQRVGMIMARFRDRFHEPPTEANLFLFRFLEDSIFPADGRFCEVFQLWVNPAYRRLGLATRLKLLLEEESRKRAIHMIYTHTEAVNQHVVDMNLKLGYQEVRCGPLWDEIPRVSLVKWLDS